MYKFVITFMILQLASQVILPKVARADNCEITDRLCLLQQLEETAFLIENKKLQDRAFQNLAVTYADAGLEDKSLEIIKKISVDDLRANTMKDVGIAAAKKKWKKQRYIDFFKAINTEAQKIESPPAYAKAISNIATLQALTKDYEGANETIEGMENEVMKRKGLSEIAEIQARHNHFAKAMATIEKISGSSSYKDKTYFAVALVAIKKNNKDYAYKAAQKIVNTYKRAEVLQGILNAPVTNTTKTTNQ